MEKDDKEIHAKLFSKVIVQLGRAKSKKEELTCHLQNLEEKLQSIEDKKKVLQQELIDLKNQGMEIS